MKNRYELAREREILHADPLDLVVLLYEAAVTALQDAKEPGPGRLAALAKVQAILMELSTSLQHERGGPIAANLRDLYGYIANRLQPLLGGQEPTGEIDEAIRLLSVLLEAWRNCRLQAGATAEQEVADGAAISVAV
jgi:flagellar protein FliS